MGYVVIARIVWALSRVNHSPPPAPAVIPSGPIPLRHGVLRDVPGSSDPPDLALVGFGNPQRAVRPCRYPGGPGERRRHRVLGDVPCRSDSPDFVAELLDRKSTRLNSSHLGISYAVFCLKK